VTRAAVTIAVVLGLVLAFTRDAAAHARSVSWSAWRAQGDDLQVRVRVARFDLDAVPGLAAGSGAPASQAYLEKGLRAEGCAVIDGSYAAGVSDPDDVVGAWRLRCPDGAHVRITTDLFFDVLPAHVHFASLLDAGGKATAERVLTADARTWDLGRNGPAASTGVGGFVLLGARHVATGADHLVFLLALLAGATSLRALAAVVTGFTIGHSSTLALAVLGGVRPDAAVVEALIGASIAVVAVENVWLEERDPWTAWGLVVAFAAAAGASLVHASIAPWALVGLALFVASHFAVLARSKRPASLRWTIAALFGAVHGLAFSGVLAEMHLPRGRVASSLFGFNVGVEIAQLAIVAVAWPLWRAVARGRARAPVLEVASAAALGAGAFWFVARAFGG
jgi:hypothetical protein